MEMLPPGRRSGAMAVLPPCEGARAFSVRASAAGGGVPAPRPYAQSRRFVWRRLDLIGAARRIGQGKGTGALNARQLQVDVLPSLEGHGPVQLQVHALDGRRQVHQAADHRVVVAHRVAGKVGVGVGFGSFPTTVSPTIALNLSV